MRRLWLVAVLGLVACPRTPAPVVDAGALPPGAPVPVAEHEPNDALAQPQALVPPCVVSGQLSGGPKPDHDWYRLDAPAGQRATITLDPAPGVDLAMEVYDSDQVKRLTQDAQPGGQPEVIRDLDPARARLIHVFGRGEAVGTYRLTVTLAPADPAGESEPDNRAADATPLPLDAPVQGHLTDPGDEDWFHLLLPMSDGGEVDAGAPTIDAGVIEVDAGALADGGLEVDGGDGGASVVAPPTELPATLVHLTVTGVAGVRLEVSVVDAAGATLFSVRGKQPGDAVEVRNLALRGRAPDVNVVVRSAPIGTRKDAKRGASVDAPYTLSVSLEAIQSAVEQEPNDDLAHATPIDPAVGIRGYLSPKGDVDTYVLRSDAPETVRAEVSGVEHLDLELSVVRLDARGREQELQSANDGELKEPEVLTHLAVGPGQDLVLRVRAAARKGRDGKWTRDGENAKEPYRLTVIASPGQTTTELEPDDTPELATPIALGQTLRGNIQPRRDVDYYRLDLGAQPVKTVLHITCTGILKVDIALALYRQGPEGGAPVLVQSSDSGKGEASEALSYAAEPGVYFLEVQDAKNRQSNFLDSYTLHVEGN